jgi:cystathionine beta-synthase
MYVYVINMSALYYHHRQVNEMIQFKDPDAFDTCQLLAKREGMMAGGSAGANVWAGMQIAKRLHGEAPAEGGKKKTIVCILPDSGLKYMSKIFNPTWIAETYGRQYQ